MRDASLRDKIGAMNMRIMTVLAVASLAFAGAACSESKTKASTESTDTVTADAGAGGTLNLSLPGSMSDTQVNGGTLNLNIGGAGNEEPRLIGADQFSGVDFNDVPETTFESPADEASADDDDDDIIRLTPN